MVPLKRALLLLLVVAGCSRSQGASVDGGADVVAIDAAAPAAIEDLPTPPTWSEARRARIDAQHLGDEPALAKNEATLKAHFGGALPGAIALQATPLASGRQVILAQDADGEPRPIALLADAEGNAIWTREHPNGGLVLPVRAFTLAQRDESGVAFFFWDEPTRLLGARLWTAAATPFADLVIGEVPQVDAIAVAWWPQRGWLVVASAQGHFVAQLLAENGKRTWEPAGAAIATKEKVTRVPSIALDTDVSWMLVHRVKGPGGDHVRVARYDTQATAIWKKPLDLGPIREPSPRVDVARARDGAVRVTFDGKTIEVRSDGTSL